MTSEHAQPETSVTINHAVFKRRLTSALPVYPAPGLRPADLAERVGLPDVRIGQGWKAQRLVDVLLAELAAVDQLVVNEAGWWKRMSL